MNFAEIVLDWEKNNFDQEYIKMTCEKISQLEHGISKVIYEKLIDYVRENNLDYAYPWIINNYGWVQHGLGNFKKAIEIHTEAYKIFEKVNDKEGILSTINALVGNYSFLQIFDKAIEYGMKGIDLAESVGNYQALNSIKNNMAIAYVEIEEFEKAKELFEQIAKLPNFNIKHNTIVNLLNLGECERELKNYDKSLKYLEEALNMAEKFYINLLSSALSEIGRTYLAKGLYDEADSNFKESVRVSIERENNQSLNEALLYWAELDLEMGRYKEAIEKLKELADNIDGINSRRNQSKVYSYISLAYKNISNFEQAYYYLEKANEIEKDMFKNRNLESIKNLDRKREEEEEKVYKLLYNQTEALYSVGQRMTAKLKKESIYNIIAEEINNLIKCDMLQISIINKEENRLEYQLCTELGQRLEMMPTSLDDERFGVYAIKHKQDIIINDLSRDYYKYFDNLEEYIKRSLEQQKSAVNRFSQSMIFVPIIVNDKVIGVMSVQSYEKNAFSLKDVTTLKILSTYTGIALENARLYKEIKYRANYDVLTKILNRREVLRRSEYIFNEAKICSNSHYVMMIDVDNFKNINDTYGHLIGDKVLSSVAEVIKSSIRKGDIVGRYGGEEFIVIIKAEDREYYKVAERIRRNVEGINLKSDFGNSIKVTSSIGISRMDAKEKTLQQIISMSDKALYEAKNTGKNKVVVYA